MNRNILAVVLTPIFLLLTTSPILGASQPYITDGHGINFGSGNKYLVEKDIELHSPTFEFTRIYNSQATRTTSLGYGWQSPFQERLDFPGGNIVRITDTGRHSIFLPNGPGEWVNELGKYSLLVAVAGGYQLTFPDDSVNTYDSSGRLLETEDKNGYTRTYSYAADLLASVTDSHGTQFSFTYNINDQLETLTTPVGSFGYTYVHVYVYVLVYVYVCMCGSVG